MNPYAAWLAMATLAAAPLAAEERAELERGRRVRLRTEGSDKWTQGKVVELDGETLVLSPHSEARPVRVRWGDVRELETSRGRTHGGAIAGALLLGVPAAGIGVVGGSFACFDEPSDCNATGEELAGGLLGAVVGGGLGYLLGSAFDHERWEPRQTPHLRLSIAPQRGGASVSLAVHF
jgi:hypothetical protein